MSRLADAILQGGYSRGKSDMLDLSYGGQNGFAPNLTEWVSQTHYVRRNIHCILLEAPRGFQYLPEPAFWISALKNMVEVHARTITGLNAGLEVSYSEVAVSGGGEQLKMLLMSSVSVLTSRLASPTCTAVPCRALSRTGFCTCWVIRKTRSR